MVSPSWQLCKYLRNDTRNAIGDAKRGVLAALPPGIVQGEGAETAAARTVKKKKLRNSSSRYLRVLYSSDDVFAKNGKSGLTKI